MDPTHFHEVTFFVSWYEITLCLEFSRCSWKMCTKILGCRSTNFSEFSCDCRYFFVVLLTAWWYQGTLIKERNIKDTQNWKQAHDLVTSTLPNLSPDLTPPYLQVHQTAVVDVVSLKGFPNALLPADARASQNLLEGNRSTSVKKTGNKEETTLTHLWSPMHGPPPARIQCLCGKFQFWWHDKTLKVKNVRMLYQSSLPLWSLAFWIHQKSMPGSSPVVCG